MSHLHIPDGVLPWWLVAAGWILTLGLLALVTRELRREEAARRLPLVGVVAALMLVGMTLEIVPIAYHVNLTVLAGIVLGPALGLVAAFVVDVILGLLGHGGVTVIGLNTLMIGAEIALGSAFFQLARRLVGAKLLAAKGGAARPRRLGLAAGLATVASLLLSTLLMIGIVGVSAVDPGQQSPALESGELAFSIPTRGLVKIELLGEAHAEADVHHAERPHLDLATFAKIVFALGFVGWLIEGTLIGLIVSYVGRVRPDLLARS